MDTRALGGDFFLPRAEIFAVEMKTVTQYTALIRITAQMEQKGIPDLKGKKRRKGSLDQALVSIMIGCSEERWLKRVVPHYDPTEASCTC